MYKLQSCYNNKNNIMIKQVFSVGTMFNNLKYLGEGIGKVYVKPDGKIRKVRTLTIECICGKVTEMTLSDIKRNITGSCGCLLRIKGANYKHGHNKKGASTSTYHSYSGMKSRVLDKNNPAYNLYKDRVICERWLDKENGFINFLTDMGEKPKNKTIDRIDNEKGYSPDNCRWASPAEQSRNRSTTLLSEKEVADIKGFYVNNYHKTIKSLKDIATYFNTKPSTISKIATNKNWKDILPNLAVSPSRFN